MNLTLKVKDVQFVNHNNRTAARSYIDLCNKLSKSFVINILINII